MMKQSLFTVIFAITAFTIFADTEKQHPIRLTEPLVANAPLLSPQPDGILSLNVDAAAIIQWSGGNPYDGTPQLVNGNKGQLKVEDGHITSWNGYKERPYWRIQVPRVETYRVVITRSAASGRESTAWISFWKKGGGEQARLTRQVDPTGSWGVWSPFEMGEVTLPVGEYTVEYTPRDWASATFLINLVDVRLIPVSEVRNADAAFQQAILHSGITAAPAVKVAADAMASNTAILNRYQALLKSTDFKSFTSYRNFIELDEAAAGVKDVKEKQTAFDRAYREAVLKESRRLASTGTLAKADGDAITRYLAALDTVEQAATKTYPLVWFTPPTAPAATPSATPTEANTATGKYQPLFPTGDLQALPKLGHAPDEKPIELGASPASDMDKRAKMFDERNSDSAIADLCRRFSMTLIPGTPGLETFETLIKQEKFREALTAYRRYFFEKLATPSRFGGCDENFVYTQIRSAGGKRQLLKTPDPTALELNSAGASWQKPRSKVFVIRHGLPGKAVWAPLDLAIPAEAMEGRSVNPDASWWNTTEGKCAQDTIIAWSALRYLAGNNGNWQSWSGFFPNLLFDYTVNRSKESLSLWSAYMDDFCMNGRADQNRCQVDIRQVTELETQMLRGHLNLLRVIYDERPAFAEELDPATLARMLMMLVTDYAPYTIRMRRAEQANWGIMGLCHLHNVAALLPEFKAMNYFNREMWRAQMANTVQHRTLDGENMEAWDLGHNYVDTGYQLFSIPFARPIPETDKLFLDSFWENVKVMERNWVVHLSPCGFYWPTWSPNLDLAINNFKTHMHSPMHLGRTHQDLVMDDPGVARRTELATQAATRSVRETAASSANATLSDIAPYGAMAYLREAWAKDADYLIFMNWRARSQENDSASRTGYLISRGERMLLEAPALAVDRKPDQYMLNAPRTGGKTMFCAQAGRSVENMRFHSSPRFDYVDGWQDVPWAMPNVTARGDYFGLYPRANGPRDPNPVTTVRSLRQVHYLRGENLYVIADRIEAPAGEAHEYTQFFALPGCLPQTGFAERVAMLAVQNNPLVEENVSTGIFRTRNPGFDNVAVRCIASGELTYANRLDVKREHVKDKTTLIAEIAAAVQKGQTYNQIMSVFSRNGGQFARLRPVSARWQGTGSQTLISVVNMLPRDNASAANNSANPRELAIFARNTGESGVIGFTATTSQGTKIAFQSGPKAANRLICGSVSATAESLLVVEKNGEFSGLALGCSTFSFNAKPVKIPCGDFEFSLSITDNRLLITDNFIPIHRPIDTVRILPETTCFTDTIDIRFDIPTQDMKGLELRYTLDGNEPTLDSSLYTKPVTITETTRVRVRPFRKGLKETPWHFTGTECGRTMEAVFRKRAPLPALNGIAAAKPGLRYTYHEGDWLTLFSYAGFTGVLDVKARGETRSLLDSSELKTMRKTDGAYAVRYEGQLKVPSTGVYSFYAPIHLYTTTMDAGYDMRVFIDGQEWFPAPDTHAEGIWSVPLEAGAHRFEVAFTDYRAREFRNEMWMNWKSEEIWQGTPVLEVSGPEMKKQPLPVSWLWH